MSVEIVLPKGYVSYLLKLVVSITRLTRTGIYAPL
jgi:hypothetical protein